MLRMWMAERVQCRIMLLRMEMVLEAIQTAPGRELLLFDSHVIGTMIPYRRLLNTTSLIWRVLDASPVAAFVEQLLRRYTRRRRLGKVQRRDSSTKHLFYLELDNF